ncbi:putative reverse transcriptase domain-containing protein, partial [Tanacetum coccineum]
RALAFEKQNRQVGSSSSRATTGDSGSGNVASRFAPSQAKAGGGSTGLVSRASGSSGLKCFNCGEPGHRQSECKKDGKRHLYDNLEGDDDAAYEEYEEAPVYDEEPECGEEYVSRDMGVNLVVRRSCLTPKADRDNWLKHNIFQSTCTISGGVKITLMPNKPKEVISFLFRGSEDYFEDKLKMRYDVFVLIGKEVAEDSEIHEANDSNNDVPRGQYDEWRRQVEELVSKGHVRESMSPCAIPALLTPKKDGTWCMCVDSQAIRKITVRYKSNPSPLGNDDFLDQISGATIFTKLDLKSGYYQIRLRPGDEWKTAFKTRLFIGNFVVVYIDDILIVYASFNEHVSKKSLATRTNLELPYFSKVFELHTDASKVAIGGVLSQDGRPVAYFSEKLTELKSRYTTYDLEFYVVVQAVKHLCHYLFHKEFVLFTDHDSLRDIRTQDKVSHKHGRWLAFLEKFTFVVKHKSGVSNRAAYTLSRRSGLLVTMQAGEKPDFFMHEGFLFKGNQLCIPDSSFRLQIIKELHGEGHVGRDRPLQLVQASYFWPTMRKEVDRYVKRCRVCQGSKGMTTNACLYMPFPIPLQPWVDITRDIVLGAYLVLKRGILVGDHVKAWDPEVCVKHEFAHNPDVNPKQLFLVPKKVKDLFAEPKFLIKMPPKKNRTLNEVHELELKDRVMARMEERFDQFVDQLSDQMDQLMNRCGNRNVRGTDDEQSKNPFREDDDSSSDDNREGFIDWLVVVEELFEFKEVLENKRVSLIATKLRGSADVPAVIESETGIMESINMFDPMTLSDAYQRALAFEKQNRRVGSSSSPAITGTSGSGNVASRFAPSQAKAGGGNNGPVSKASGSSGLKCFNCGEPVHRQSECKKASKRHLFADPEGDDNVAYKEYEEALVYDEEPECEEEYVSGDVGWLKKGGDVTVSKCVHVLFSVGNTYKDNSWCDVVSNDACHLLLGRHWEYDRDITHNGRTNTYSFLFGGVKITLMPNKPKEVISKPTGTLLTLSQFEDELEMGDDVFVLIGKEVAEDSEIPKAMIPLLEEFSDVFPDELPDGLPPLRDIQHHIDLEPVSQLPNRPHYRMSPREHEELRRHIDLIKVNLWPLFAKKFYPNNRYAIESTIVGRIVSVGAIRGTTNTTVFPKILTMSINEQTPLSQSTSVLRNTLGKEPVPQDPSRPIFDEALREYYDRNYHQILPNIAKKVHQEKAQQEKLKAVKARFNFEETSRDSESRTPIKRRDLNERLGPRYVCGRSGSPEPRRGRSESPKKKGSKRKTVVKRQLKVSIIPQYPQ